nr:Thiamine-phosphate synthase [Paraburkholderia busanensis]
MDRTDFIERLSGALLRGIELVQLRSKTMAPQAYADLAGVALELCHRHGARMIANAPDHFAQSIETDGLHLSSAKLMQCTVRPLPTDKLLAAACHSLEQLLHAQKIGVDLVTLSPVLATITHPDATPMGWERFAELTSQVRIPVYALGGMKTNHVAVARSHGARGIAAISSLW